MFDNLTSCHAHTHFLSCEKHADLSAVIRPVGPTEPLMSPELSRWMMGNTRLVSQTGVP